MSKNHNINVTPVERSEIGLGRDAPAFNDTPLTGEFVAQCSTSQSTYAMPSRLAMGIRTNLFNAFVRTTANVRRNFGALRHQASKHRRGLDPFVTFARETLVSPRAIGAVCPSSPDLARAMARELRNIDDGLVLELGAGTGSITNALLQQGIAPARLIAVERSPALAEHLRKRFPAVRVIDGDAKQLGQLLGNDAARVRAVVSGLPLRSLHPHVAQEIVQQIREILPEDGVFVQFTYDLRKPSVWRDRTLRNMRTRVVWKNMPPARVDTFVRQMDISNPNG